MSTVKKVLVAVLMMCLAAACTGTGSTGGGAALTGSGAGTVVVALPSDDPGDIHLRQAEAKEFMKQNPDINVKVLTIPGQNYDEKVVTMIAGGKPPDIFGSGDVQIPNIVRKHYAVDLAPIIKAEKYDTADFYPQVIQGLTFGGKLVGLTDNWDTQVLYYNKSLFDAKHVPYPTDQWSWEDFREAARKLTSGSGAKEIYGAVYDPWFAPMYDQIWSYGGEVFSKDGTKCMLNSPQSTAAIQWIADLFKEGVSPGPSQLSQQGQDASQIFLSGRAAMSIGSGRWSAFDLKDVQKFKWAIAPAPKGPAGRANFFHLAMFAIAANSKNKAGAWKFLKYLVSEEGIRMAAKNMQGIPSRQSLAKDHSITQSPLVVEHDAYQPFIASLPTVHSAPYVPNFGQLQDKIDAALDPVWAGKKQASEATGPLCADLDKSLATAGGP